MPIEPTSFASSLWATVSAKLPYAATASRDNVAMGIVPHNPFMEMVMNCGVAWASTILTPGIIKDVYNGLTGAPSAAAAPTPMLFPRAATVAAAFQSSMGWAGASSAIVANALTTDVWTLTMSIGMIQMYPLMGASTGVGVVNPLSLSGLGPTFTSNLQAQFSAKGFFSPGDTKAGLTPEISLLITNLSAAYAMNMGGLTTAAPIPYVGPPAPPPPATPGPYVNIPNSGSII